MIRTPTIVTSPRNGGPFSVAPGGTGGYATTTMGPGSSTTVVGGGPAPGGGGDSPYGDLLRKLIERKLAATDPAAQPTTGGLVGRRSYSGAQRRGGGGEGGGAMADALAARKFRDSSDAYDASVRGSVTGPVGLTAGMVPGMQAKVERLPARMLPGTASIVDPGTRVPTGSIASPVYDPNDLASGYGAANPRAAALEGMMRGQADPIEQIMYGRQGVPAGQPKPTPAYYRPPR